MVDLMLYVEWWEDGPGRAPFEVATRLVSHRFVVQVPEGARVRSLDLRAPGDPGGRPVAWVGKADAVPYPLNRDALMYLGPTVGYVSQEPIR